MDLNFINLYDVTQTSLIQKSNINFKFDLQILNHLILKKKKTVTYQYEQYIPYVQKKILTVS